MMRCLKEGSVVRLAFFAALVAAAAALIGCGSPPAAEQGTGQVPEETAQAPEQPPAEEGAPVEPAPPQTATAKAPPVPASPSPGPPAPAPSAPAASVPAPAASEDAPPGKPAETPPAPAAALPAAAAAVDWAGSAQKWVPIFSLETEGVYLGAAQVAGSASQVGKVKGVAELRLKFKDIGRVYAYVPVSTISLTKLDRVQGVSVWAIGDLQLAGF